jgi:hypothetical protein
MLIILCSCCRVYEGNSDGEQGKYFHIGVGRAVACLKAKGIDAVVESMTTSRMRRECLSLQYVIDWLLGSHIHFVITHPHQGLEGSYSVKEIYDEVGRLKFHQGFPSMNTLECPIFCQDKFRYLAPLIADNMILSTCRIPLFEQPELGKAAAAEFMYSIGRSMLFFWLHVVNDILFVVTLSVVISVFLKETE